MHVRIFPHTSPKAVDESGFTMLLTLVVMVIAGLLLTAAFTAANGDIHLTHNDQLEKKAYYAAQAGLNDYAFHLNRDVNYWTHCSEVPAPNAVNSLGDTPLKTRLVPGTTDESYAIQLIPASTDTEPSPQKCDPVNPVLSMVETGIGAGTFRIQSTGYATSGSTVDRRTVVATFAHTSFLNFVYYTKYETSDPVTYSDAAHKYNECAKPREEREALGFCNIIDFISEDNIQGPVHSEDSPAICGEPIFGRTKSDAVEFKGGTFDHCPPSKPDYKGTQVAQEKVLTIEPPPSNTSLLAITEGPYHYVGRTELFLHGSAMDVTNSKGETAPNVPFPPKGVVYVSNKACSVKYTPYAPDDTGDTECGNVYVHGSYNTPLTIAAENDIIINGNVSTPVDGKGNPTTNGVLGLIANNFVRVYHPMPSRTSHVQNQCDGASNGGGATSNITVYAAILAVNHSFIVDNYDCGEALGKLTIHGAVAQIFRGVVGIHSGPVVLHGYLKNYVYDDRLQVESPPYFLNPVDAAWHIRRETLASSP
jgi:type II secretory pathway pseudopilin PulG